MNDDYGALYQNGSLFRKLFPDFDEHQKQAAAQIWQRVLGRCGVDIGMPAITNIIDFGCGDGSLTFEIAKLANSRSKGVGAPIRTIGIDSSALAIKLAEAEAQKNPVPNVEFYHCGSGCEDLFASLSSAEIERQLVFDWSRTAFMCLGHTWFHLDQNTILRSLRTFRPAILLIEIFHSWDATIQKLTQKGEKEVLEFGRLITDQQIRQKSKKTATYWLRTKLKDKDSGTVERGLWKASGSSGRGKWLFQTEQRASETASLLGQASPKIADEGTAQECTRSVRSVTQILDDARKKGALTADSVGVDAGREGADYIVRKVIRHRSGWGEMRCHALVRRDHIASCLNDAYFHLVAKVVRCLFVTGDCDARFANLQRLLALYDEPDDWRKEWHFAGSREAMVVLPFDRDTTFARIIGLFPNSPDAEISKYDLIVEAPSADQRRFPTAYGLFHTLEARASSPQALPLAWASDYDHTEVDEAFGVLENMLLGIKPPQPNLKVSEEEAARGYFLLPIYFGSLPLFVLSLRFPKLFPPESTDYQVYFSALTNLHSEIKVALTDEFIRTELIRPWLSAALNALILQPDIHGNLPTVEGALLHAERMLFGRATDIHDEDAPDVPLVEIDGQLRCGGVLAKEWKSWLLGIPSFPIKKLRSVKADNKRLWQIWLQEAEAAKQDADIRLSGWFQQGRFFEGKEHEKWTGEPHLLCLHKMCVDTGLTDQAENPASDNSWLQTVLARLRCLLPESDSSLVDRLNPDPRNYFAQTREHFLFRWMAERFQELYESRENGARGPNETFLDLKAVFCKASENTGERVRFGIRRLLCLLDAACLAGELVQPQRGARSFTDWMAIDSKRWSPDDPSISLAEFVHALHCFRLPSTQCLAGISVKYGPVKDPVTIDVKIHTALSKSEGGGKFRVLNEAFGKVAAYAAQSTVVGTTCFQFSFRVTPSEKGIQFEKASP